MDNRCVVVPLPATVKPVLLDVETGSRTHPACCTTGAGISSPRRRAATARSLPHDPPPAKIKNKWSHTSIPPICIHEVHMDNFIVYLWYATSLCYSIDCCAERIKTVSDSLNLSVHSAGQTQSPWHKLYVTSSAQDRTKSNLTLQYLRVFTNTCSIHLSTNL